jgi:hypothetical protein
MPMLVVCNIPSHDNRAFASDTSDIYLHELRLCDLDAQSTEEMATALEVATMLVTTAGSNEISKRGMFLLHRRPVSWVQQACATVTQRYGYGALQ